MRGPGLFDRRIRGFRIVELGAMAVLAALVLVVYLAKDGAGDKRDDIDRVEQAIVAEQDQIRLLRAEVAHQEQPERLGTLANRYLHLQPIPAKHEVDAAALATLVGPAAPAAKAGAAAPPSSAAATAKSPPPSADLAGSEH